MKINSLAESVCVLKCICMCEWCVCESGGQRFNDLEGVK